MTDDHTHGQQPIFLCTRHPAPDTTSYFSTLCSIPMSHVLTEGHMVKKANPARCWVQASDTGKNACTHFLRARTFRDPGYIYLAEPISRPQEESCSKRKAVYKGAAPVQKRCGDKVHGEVG